jgi:CheY-like chemotaxis protein
MTARILVADDEPDLETLIQQKFRHQIRAGAVSFVFVRDGMEALSVLEAKQDVDLVVTDINMPRMDGLTLLEKVQQIEGNLSTISHEPRRVRFPDQTDRFSRFREHDHQDHSACRSAARSAAARGRESAA